MRPAKLPITLISPTIAGMMPGSRGCTVPWAMVVDLEGYAFIRGDYIIHDGAHGTATMLVTRLPSGAYIVKIAQADAFRWSLQDITEQEHREWILLPIEEIEYEM